MPDFCGLRIAGYEVGASCSGPSAAMITVQTEPSAHPSAGRTTAARGARAVSAHMRVRRALTRGYESRRRRTIHSHVLKQSRGAARIGDADGQGSTGRQRDLV